jgi:hypothetical protein
MVEADESLLELFRWVRIKSGKNKGENGKEVSLEAGTNTLCQHVLSSRSAKYLHGQRGHQGFEDIESVYFGCFLSQQFLENTQNWLDLIVLNNACGASRND